MDTCEICDYGYIVETGPLADCCLCGAKVCDRCQTKIAGANDKPGIYCDRCAEAYQNGVDCGTGAASWLDMPEIGQKLPPDFDWVGYETVTKENIGDVFAMLAGESEMASRDYSPWEFIASRINSEEEVLSEGLWGLYDLGVEQGIAAEWKARSAAYAE